MSVKKIKLIVDGPSSEHDMTVLEIRLCCSVLPGPDLFPNYFSKSHDCFPSSVSFGPILTNFYIRFSPRFYPRDPRTKVGQ